MSESKECAAWRCESERLPNVSFCHAHLPRYEIPPHDELECPECGETGQHGTIHDGLYYCREDDCGGFFDPRRFGDND